MSRILRDIQSFVSGKDLVVFAIALALSNNFQALLKVLIDTLIMPFVSQLTGPTNLASRTWELQAPISGKNLGINLGWGAALQAIITFVITLVIMVEIARYLTVKFVKSSTVTFT
jgi:large-conductance mechanosensitive channel